MLCISLLYNKQEFDVPRPNLLTDQFHLAHDYLHNVSERPRQLSNYDLCLGLFDCDWHLPLVCRISAHAIKNKRTRGPEAQEHRNQRYRSWASRQGKGQQPSRNDQQWTDQQWYQDQGFQEDHYHHPTSRYYSRHGPYTSHGSSSSSTAPRWEGWYGGLR